MLFPEERSSISANRLFLVEFFSVREKCPKSLLLLPPTLFLPISSFCSLPRGTKTIRGFAGGGGQLVAGRQPCYPGDGSGGGGGSGGDCDPA